MRTFLFLFAIIIAAPVAFAQDQGGLSRAFEGRTVTLKIDMPATSEGVEVKPLAGTPLDFHTLANLIKSCGIGVHRGESIMVTKVVVKAHHIEFQLGGGGFGTFSDMLSTTPTTYVPYEAKSHREKDLEQDLKYSYDSYDRRAMKDELHDLQRDRNRDNAFATAANAQAQQAAAADERAKRAQGGGRFNIRYNDGFPQGALTPTGIMEALDKYVDFGQGGSWTEASTHSSASSSTGTTHALRKGLTVLQVEQILGPAANVSRRSEGSIDMTIREYATEEGEQVKTQFVGGILVDYTITPRR